MAACDDVEYTPADFPQVSTRGHFDAFGRRNDDKSETGYDLVNRQHVPGLNDEEPPKELTLFVHGLGQSRLAAVTKFCSVTTAMRDAGYDYPVLGFTWDSNYNGWYRARHVSKRNGPKLAQFVSDYQQSRDTEVRVVAHSLGSMVAIEALGSLTGDDQTGEVASVALVGGAVRAAHVARDGPLGQVIQAYGQEGFSVRNYWSKHDETLRKWFKPAEFGAEAVGRTGCRGQAPDRYEDHDVSDDVDDHNAYILPKRGCMGRVVGDLTP